MVMKSVGLGLMMCCLLVGGCTTSAGGSPPHPLSYSGPVSSSAGSAVSAAALAAGRWSVLPASGLAASSVAVLAWDGTELIQVDAGRNARSPGPAAGYDPRRGSWRRLSPAPDGVAGPGTVSVWTGRELFAMGVGQAGPADRDACCVAGLFDPIADRWRSTPPVPLHSPGAVAVWTGREVVVADVVTRRQPLLEAAGYDPAANRWTRLDPPVGRPDHPPMVVEMVAVPDGVLVWSLWSRMERTGPGSITIYAGTDLFRLAPDGHWSDLTRSWPQDQNVVSPVFTGSSVLLAPGQVWCGPCSHPMPYGEHAVFVDPRTLARTDIAHGPADDVVPRLAWTGDAILAINVWGSMRGEGAAVGPGDTFVWNRRTGTWVKAAGAPLALADTPLIWTGRELLTLARNGRLMAFRPQ